MRRTLGLAGATALIGIRLVASCASTPAATGQVVAIDHPHDGSTTEDHRETGASVQLAHCQSIPPGDDVGCPDAASLWGPCEQVGQRCMVRNLYEGIHLLFRCGVDPSFFPRMPPSWIHDAYYYDLGAIPPLQHNLAIETSDCASRPIIPCVCSPGETAEMAIERNGSITGCQTINPIVFVTFDDAGCPSRAQYGNGSHESPDFATCLTDALSGLRFECVGSSRVDLQACKLEYSIVSPK